MPEKYLALAKRHKDFAWAAKVGRDDAMVSRGGWERHEGSGMRDWFSFYRIDINNDGHCDWYLNASTPLSTGGDRDSINTVYLGHPEGWVRIGASIPNDKPDQLGFGKAAAEQQKYLFGEEPGVIYDASQKISYLITALYNRHDGRSAMPGYRILTWDASGKTLRALDKWQPGSKAAEVYVHFKKSGAYAMPVKGQKPDEAVLHFDQEVEAFELEQACADPADADAAGAGAEVAVSAHLLASTCAHAAPQPTLALRSDAPQCKTPTAKLPKLGVDARHDAPTEITADFNGDGWCDYALGVPYPINSRMNAYDLSQLMVLGQAGGWKRVFNGKKSHQLADEGVSSETWPTFRIDLTDIRLVFPARRGAPFVLGLMAGGDEDGKRDMGNGCHQYRSVHRWDDAHGTFRKADAATRDAVLSYFYSVLEKPCNAEKSLGASLATGDIIPTAPAYQLLDLSGCKTPKLAPPAPPKDSYEAYGFRRRLLDLDGSGNCVLMDFWIERLGGSAAAGIRSFEHRFQRVVGGKWQPFDTGLDYFPHALKARANGKVYLVDARVNEDTGDVIVAKHGGPRVFTVTGWQQETGFLPVLALQAEESKRVEVSRALAALLREGASAAADQSGAQHARIRMLEKAAAGQ